ncbi:MAG: MBL fold metallo-hydrolase [Gammaproteobacteria bacterium]|nr:MBL fold metallo-hydrolase [Gammaproteobacteria bacterium]
MTQSAMQYTCYGAAQEVTGSCHLVEANGFRVLLDCGLIQGSDEEEARNAESFPFDATTIDAVILSHAHIDHSGRLPLLFRAGFTGPIYTHAATRDLCTIMLRDSAFINERNAEWLNRHRKNNNGEPVQPLYNRDDVDAVMTQFEAVEYDARINVLPGIDVRFNDAGHILGAGIVELWLSQADRHCKLVYSGDLGFGGRPVLRDPTTIADADMVILESTYGNRNHRSLEDTYDELEQILGEAGQASGNILIPAFAVGRSQALLHLFARNRTRWQLNRWQIFLDSPMAIEATEVYFRHVKLLRKDAQMLWRPGQHNDVTDQLSLTRTVEESMAINRVSSGAIIIAASGMCTGGRIRHHLKHHIGRKTSHVIIVGYQERGTPGRALVDGARELRLMGKRYPVAATIHTVGGLSAHADQAGLLAWYRAFRDAPPVVLVHGEPDAQLSLQQQLEPIAPSVTVARFGHSIPLPEHS